MTDMTTRQIGANGGALPSLADDILPGAKAIATFIYGDDDRSVRRVYHAAAKLGLPVFRIGSVIHARRSSILKWVESREAA